MKKRRLHRISEELKRELSDIIQNKLKDPRIPTLISVSYVDVTNDLSFATVGISIFGDEKVKRDAMEGLENAKGFIKKELGNGINIRIMPDLIFKLDESIEKNLEMQAIIDKLHAEDEF